MRPGELPKKPTQGVCLRCEQCGEQFSACRADYTLAEQAEEMACMVCGGLLELVRRVVQFRRVRLARAG